MKQFRDLPIRQKLTLTMVAIAVTAVTVTGCLRITCDFLTFRRAAIEDLSMQAEIIGENCAAALEFDNPQAAEETLASLKARPDIVAACVHHNDGRLLAGYRLPEAGEEPFPSAVGPREWIKNGHLLVQRPVLRGGEVLGTVHLRSNLQPHYSRLKVAVLVMLISMFFSIALALALSLRLQRVFTRPILELAAVANQVTQHQDYSLRAKQIGNDEIGALTDRFNRMLATIQEREAKLRHLSLQLLQSQDRERRRLARELHDATGQLLVGVGLTLGNLKHSVATLPQQERELLAQATNFVQRCTEELRTLSYLLYPPLLDDLGLAAAMESYVQGFTQRTGIRVSLELPPNLQRFSRETELVLFRVLQESLTNIQRHSGSPTAHICLSLESGNIILQIEDQGKGLAASNKPAASDAPPGVGILIMRERLEELGGEFTLRSSSAGTTVRATLPVTTPSAENHDGSVS